MPFESQWARIPLAVRWVLCALIAVALVVALVAFVSHNTGNSLAHISAKNNAKEAQQAQIIIGQDQAPHSVIVNRRGDTAAQTALVAGIRGEMRRQIAKGTFDGPLTSVRCGRSGAAGGRIGYHCLAEADHVSYPFLAVFTPATHRAAYCKKDFAPQEGENIPVSARCQL